MRKEKAFNELTNCTDAAYNDALLFGTEEEDGTVYIDQKAITNSFLVLVKGIPDQRREKGQSKARRLRSKLFTKLNKELEQNPEFKKKYRRLAIDLNRYIKYHIDPLCEGGYLDDKVLPRSFKTENKLYRQAQAILKALDN